MDLWIRSQDRKRLVKVFDIYIGGTYGNEIKANYAGYYSGCSYTNLGEYKTEERALEVLDEIQKLLIPTYLISNISFIMPLKTLDFAFNIVSEAVLS